MNTTQRNRLSKIEEHLEKKVPNKAIALFEGVSPAKQQIRTVMMDSFEKEEIGLTTDRIARIINDQIISLFEIQKKINTDNPVKYHKFHNTGLSIYAAKQIKEYLELILRVRGDLLDTKMQVAQQFNFKDNSLEKNSFEDYVLQLSGDTGDTEDNYDIDEATNIK